MWPPDYKAELYRRLKLYRRLSESPELRAKANALYRRDYVRFIGDMCVTYDPRVMDRPKKMPFVLFPRQVDFLHYLNGCYQDKAPGLTEKSRDVGASWLCCGYGLWLWRYHPGSAIGFGSKKEEYVDDRSNLKALLPKIRMMLNNMPPFMLPESWSAPYKKIINHSNDSIIFGESGFDIGRGGRSSIFFKDESAHYEQPESIEAALGDNTDCAIDISSVNGSANIFYRRRMAGEVWEPGKVMTPGKTRVFIFDWRDNPGKTQEWYDKRRSRAEDEGLLHVFAQEVERDYSGSVEGTIIQRQWVNACIDAHIKLGIKPDGEKVGGQDVADGGRDKNALVTRSGVIMSYANAWGGEAGDAARISIQYCSENGIRLLNYESPGVGSGFKEGANTFMKSDAAPSELEIVPWNPGEGVQDPDKNIIPDDKSSPKNEDFFANLSAQAAWALRTRIYKTFMAVTKGREYPHDELISIPSDLPNRHQLELELCQPTYDTNGKGKILIDKKPDGSVSPNLFDAAKICYFPKRNRRGFFDV